MNAPIYGRRPCETVFGLRVAMIREERGWSIPQLARHCRVSQRSMESWLGDGFEPLLSYGFKVACALGVDLDDLADPLLSGGAPRRREDAPGEWTFSGKGSVGSTAFGPTLLVAMGQRGRRVKEFAHAIGVERNRVTRWMQRRAEPRLTSAMRAAEELGLSLHGLCEGRIEARARHAEVHQ